MPQTKIPPAQLELGTRIDGNALELVEVLGVGGYGVVYRAVETCSSNPTSYAVKCLLHSHTQPAAKRQFHIREIALHQISSAHPGVVTLHRVIEDFDYTYIIMDYAPDHDLFTQILNHRRYVGDDALIKHVFLQLLDAVEYCHSLGIYHRDLKPENVLCFDNGFRVAITDFGLATTEKLSEEMRTGSIYHMSPECQGGEFAPNGSYSPMSNDVWSLGIILLNLATGRNPWKTATLDDPTFQAYLRSPLDFFQSVLPVSREINEVLVRMLHVDWRERLTLSELREMMDTVNNFYSDDVIFEGSMARCPWEAGLEIESDPRHDSADIVDEGLKSYWSEDSMLNSPSTDSTFPPPIAELSNGLPWSASQAVKIHSSYSMVADDDSTDIGAHKTSFYPYPSPLPVTPNVSRGILRTLRPARNRFMDTITDKPRQRSYDELSGISSGSSMELTTEEASRSPTDFVESPPTSLEDSSLSDLGGMPVGWIKSAASSWAYSGSRASSAPSDHSSLSGDISFVTPTLPQDHSYSPTPPPGSGTSVYASKEFLEGKLTLFNPLGIFSRGTQCSTVSRRSSEESCERPAHPQLAGAWLGNVQAPAPAHIDVEHDRHHGSRRSSRFASTRHWFLPGKFFASPVVS